MSGILHIVVSDGAVVGIDARVDTRERRVVSLAADDEVLPRALMGLAVLSGCVEAILEDEARRRREFAALPELILTPEVGAQS